ncbi:hypothetical protein RQP46_009935 [Phenoliferia psychrophenolica]
MEAKLEALQKHLEAPDVSDRRERFRDVYAWSTEHAAIAFDFLSLVPVTAPFAPLVKVVLGFAVLSADGRKATEACRGLMNRMLDIHESSINLRARAPDPEKARKPIDDAMEAITVELSDYVTSSLKKSMWSSIKGFKKGIVLEKVADWTNRVNVLQSDYIVVRIEAQGRETYAAVLQLTPTQPHLKLKGLPYNLDLVGRKQDLDRTIELLTKPHAHGQDSSQHVVLVGPGGIGKTSLATKVAYDDRAKRLGRPEFIRCEQLDSLAAFQTELLRLRAPNALHPGENLEKTVLDLLEAEPLLLILDNLLDTHDATADAPYLEFIDSITSIPSLTLLVTSRNHAFIGRNSPRKIRGFPLKGLSDGEAEALFRATYADALGEGQRKLEPNEPHMPELLEIMDGMPLTVVLVAAHARKADSLEEVVRRWKEGRASDNGAQGRTTSVDFSLKLSFSDPSINTSDTLTLLRLLAELPSPVNRRYFTSSENTSRAFHAVVDRSVGQLEGEKRWRYLRVLQPVREYILRHHSPLDINSDVVRTLARTYFESAFPVSEYNSLIWYQDTYRSSPRKNRFAPVEVKRPEDFSNLTLAMKQAQEHNLHYLHAHILEDISHALGEVDPQKV